MNNSTTTCAVWRGYLDLAAYSMEKLTFYIQGINAQENQNWVGPATNVEVIDVVSKTPISNDDLNELLLPTTSMYSPGFLDSQQDMEQVLFCRYRQFYTDSTQTNPNLLRLAHQSVWGEGSATAASRIHITRYVKEMPNIGEVALVPQAVFQIVGVPDSEAEAEYMMRLKRSYEYAG